MLNLQVASWSRPVSRAGVERAARALGVSSTDLALFAATESLRSFFEHAQSDTPDSILITARAASERFLYTFAEGNGKDYKKSQTGGNYVLFLRCCKYTISVLRHTYLLLNKYENQKIFLNGLEFSIL